MKKIFYFLLAVLAVQSVQAGDKILNGGNVIVCGNNVELLDYYEARLRGKKLQFDPSLTTYTDKLNHLFERWKEVAPKRMKQYSDWLNEFESVAGIYSGIQIPDIQDTGSVAIPNGCTMTPAAFQRRDEDIFPGEKRYVINKDLWDLMSEDQRAGLVLHELIYREAIKNAHETSLPTRFFNGFLSTEVTPDMDTYFAITYRMPMQWAEYGGLNIQIGLITCSNWPGSSGCQFDYSSEYGSDYFKLMILGVAGPIRTKEMSIDCYGGPCEPYSGTVFEYERSTGFFSLKRLASVIKNVYLKDRIFVTDIKSKYPLKIYHNLLLSSTDQNFLIDVNPETSWYQTPSGEKIEHFKGYGAFNGKLIFQSADNKIWFYSSETKSFTEYFYNVQFQGKKMACNLNSFPDSKTEYIYNCPAMPKQISCNVTVVGNNDQNSLMSVTVKFVDNRILLAVDSSGVYQVRIPKGQIDYYIKKRFGKLEAHQTTQEDWHSIWWDDRGNCQL